MPDWTHSATGVAGGGWPHAAVRPFGSSVSTSTSGASTNSRVATRTLLNGVVRHQATTGSVRRPAASTVRPSGPVYDSRSSSMAE